MSAGPIVSEIGLLDIHHFLTFLGSLRNVLPWLLKTHHFMNSSTPDSSQFTVNWGFLRLFKQASVFLAIAWPSMALADLDILIIGSSHSFSETNESGVVHETAFDPTPIQTQLQSILTGDAAVTETVNVVFEDIYRTKVESTGWGGGGALQNFNYHCYSLAQYFMWPDGRTDRLANLRGASGTAWDHIIILEDPYVLANFPGMYAEAVRLYHEEISQGTAELVLMSQWPGETSSFSALGHHELAYRAGDPIGIEVIPAAKAWHHLNPKVTSTTHPTLDGAYLAASSIYAALLNRSAASSGYDYDDTIADHAFTITQNNDGVAQYSGNYTTPIVFR
jgi:hypothetical protein